MMHWWQNGGAGEYGATRDIPPVVRGDEVLVDGGVLNVIPVDVAQSLGAGRVIAVDLGVALEQRAALEALQRWRNDAAHGGTR